MSRKNTTSRLKETEKIQQQKLLEYVTTHNNKNPQLFTEIMKNLDELKNNQRNTWQQKSLKDRDNPKIVK